MFQNQAAAVGMDKTRFSCEAAALEFFVVMASINTRRLSGGIKYEQASLLIKAVVSSHHHEFHNALPWGIELDLISLRLGGDEGYDILTSRNDEYAKPENFVAANKQIPQLFAQFCGVPDPKEILLRIGWSIFINRGAAYVDTVKKLKIV